MAGDGHTGARRIGRRRAARTAIVVALAAGIAMTRTVSAQPAAGDDRALIDAAARGDAAVVARLLKAGASVKARDGTGRTALLAATYGGHLEAARALIAAGADVNAKDDQENSAYLLAGARGFTAILRLTLANGADLKSVNRYGGTALIPAAHYGHVETVRVMLGTAVDVDHVNRLGWTALLEAIILGDGGPRHAEIVRLLLEAGASPAKPDGQGVTPLEHARKRGQTEIAGMLEAATRRR